MEMRIKKLHENSVIPRFALPHDAGLDIFAYGEHVLLPGELKKISTGVAIQLPSNCAGLIWDKSSIGSRGLKVFCGVFDEEYRGEWFIVIKNMSDEVQTFSHGQKIAQVLIQRVEHPEIIEVHELSESIRGEGGFGSTGQGVQSAHM